MKVLLTLAVLAVVYIVCTEAVFTTDGIVNPSSHHQRWRRPEYPKGKSFYQWWYYTIKDFEHGNHFAMTYGYSESDNATTTGGFLMFVHFDSAGAVSGSRYIKIPVKDFIVTGDFDVKMGDIGHLHPIDNDTFHLTAKMSGPNWYCGGPAVDCDGDIEWDITVHRIYGWYGQSEIENPIELSHISLIQWNTYSHDADVTGYISYPSQKKLWKFDPISCNYKCRAYGDMNWGRAFPHPPKNSEDRSYAWGWYSFVLPKSDSLPEFSFIMGSGKTYTGFPFATMDARFADVRFGDWHVGARVASFWSNNINTMVYDGTNDGKVGTLNFTRSDWTNYIDAHGNASIPFTQVVTVTTTTMRAVLTFRSKKEDYVRLLFAFENDIFSDFEAVGVYTEYKIEKLVNNQWQVLAFGACENGGLEFGYWYVITIDIIMIRVPMRL